MTKHEQLPMDAALHAWEVARFPILPTEAYDVAGAEAAVSGDEVLGRLFLPKVYKVARDPSVTIRTARELRNTWVSDPEISAALESNLGPNAPRVGTRILAELMYLAAYDQHASVAITAGHMLVGEEAEQTVVSLWSDGRPFDSPEMVEAEFSLDDPIPPCGRNASLRRHTADVPAHIVTKNTLQVFGGRLAVLNGSDRTDIALDGVKHTTTPGISGNLVVAYLPHVPKPPQAE